MSQTEKDDIPVHLHVCKSIKTVALITGPHPKHPPDDLNHSSGVGAARIITFMFANRPVTLSAVGDIGHKRQDN